MNVAGETSRQVAVMMPGDGLRMRVMRPGSVMMSDAGLRVTVMMMRVLPLVLLIAHQAFASVQVRGASEVIGVLVNVGVHIAVKVTVHATIDRRGLVMVLVRVQNLLNALQLILSGILFLRQAGVLFKLLVQLLAGRLEQIRSRFQQGARTRGQAVLIVLQARALLDASRRFERQVAREI